MKRSTVVLLGLATFALVVVNFVIVGFGRLLVGPETAVKFAAPTTAVAVGLAVFLAIRLSLCALDVRPLETDE